MLGRYCGGGDAFLNWFLWDDLWFDRPNESRLPRNRTA